jgi:porphobilinogen synthase
MSFPLHRPRRLRRSPQLRTMVRETTLSPANLIAPLFVQNGLNERVPIASMPGQFRLSPQEAGVEARVLHKLGVPAVILFGIVEAHEKDTRGEQASNPNGPVPCAIAAIKAVSPETVVICDACLCEYTSHGHCGVLCETPHGVTVKNDATIELLGHASVTYAQAGADIIAPSDMMDGRVGAIRAALDEEGFQDLPILSYAAKYAGSFYGPFRDAADSAPSSGDRRTYQMDIANRREALREMRLDLEEGADMLMVKPALFCLDILREARDAFDVPLCAYHVSGEYSMLKAAGQMGWIDESALLHETLLSIRRAGADLIITYGAREWAERQD